MEKSVTHTLSPQERTKKLERILGLGAILTIIAAWFIGAAIKQASAESYLAQALPSAYGFQEVSAGLYSAKDPADNTIGYVAVGEATGYGGPIRLAVGVDLSGKVIGLAIIDHKETPSYLKRVSQSPLLSSMLGKSYDHRFLLGEDLDGVTSATMTSAAIAEAVRVASREVANDQLGKIVPFEGKSEIVFGAPEIVLISLFALGYVGRNRLIKNTKLLRWGTMLTGMVVLGFIYNRPLTLSKFNMFLMGYLPEWQTNLYWYILIGGIIFVFSADNRNPYCEWFCPFGAAQECMGAIGGAKPRFSRQQQRVLDWVQRSITWLAIMIALVLRNPGVTSYEIFGALFQLNGTMISFAVLGIVLLASMYTHRFWCRALCPLRPVEGIIRLVRGWIIELWQTRIKTQPDSRTS